LAATDIQQLGYIRQAAPTDAIDGIQPRWVAEPATTEEAATILRLASESNLAVAPRGGGTKLGWGNPPERLDVILSTARMNRVLEHSDGDLVARLEAGTRLRDAQEVFARAGQWLPIDPPEPDATIGGIIAANASGPHRLRYGTMRDLLIGITYVLPDGTVAKAGGKVVKNVAGYDLCKLFTGSLGTLGLLTEVIVRLHPVPAARRRVLARGRPNGMGQVGNAVPALLHSSLVPSAVELHWERWVTLSVLFEGVDPGAEAQARAAAELLRPFADHVAVSEHERVPPRIERLPSVSRLKISLPVAALARDGLLSGIRMKTRTGRYGGPIWGHAGSGILYRDTAPDVPEAQAAAIEEIRRDVGVSGGTVVVQEAPVEVKRLLDVWGDPGDAFQLMCNIKERFDPKRIMNPGRFIGGM
jgi:glycolate oxidase FAD binding subunit